MGKKTVIKILSVDGSLIYKADRLGVVSIKGYNNGKPDFTKFKGYIDDSLDIRYMKSIYPSYKGENMTPEFFFNEPPERAKKKSQSPSSLT